MKGVLLAIAVAAALHGTARADRLVLESYEGSRPVEAEGVMARLRPMLNRRGFTADVPALARRLPNHAWIPATGSPAFDGDRFIRDVASAINDYEEARFAQAAKTLDDGLRSARANPVSWVDAPKYRDALMRCLLYDALALGRLAATASGDARQAYERRRDEVMADLIRAYPSQVIGARQYGREAAQLFDRVRKAFDDQGRGRLVVEVSGPQAVIYVDEIKQPPGAVTLDDLTAGTYRVLIDAGADARQYVATILPGRETHLDIDWKIDAMLIAKNWAGLLFASDDDRAQEAAFAQRVAQLYGDVDYVAIVTVSVEQSVIIYGRLYEVATARNVLAQQIELTGEEDDERLERFAETLRPPARDQVAMTAAPTLPTLSSQPRDSRSVRGPIAPILIAAGAVATTAGAILWATGGANQGAATAGVAIGIGGLGLVGGGIYSWISHRSRRPPPMAVGALPVRAGAVLTLTGSL